MAVIFHTFHVFQIYMNCMEYHSHSRARIKTEQLNIVGYDLIWWNIIIIRLYGFYCLNEQNSAKYLWFLSFWAGCRHSLWNAHELIKLYNIMGMLIFYCVSWCIVNVICLFNKCHHDWHRKCGDDMTTNITASWQVCKSLGPKWAWRSAIF